MSLKAIVLGTLLIPLLATGLRAAPDEADPDIRSPGLSFWYCHSVFVAKVKSRPNRDSIVAVPLGTLAGSLDAGTTPEVRTRLVRDRHGLGSFPDPVVGDAVILDADGTCDLRGTGRFEVLEYVSAGFIGINGQLAPDTVPVGHADSQLTNALRRLQQQRAKDDRANDPTSARLRKFFAAHRPTAVICAEIQDLGPDDSTYAFDVRVRRVLSGADVHNDLGIHVSFPPRDNWERFRTIFRTPRVDKTAIIALTVDENDGSRCFVSSRSLEFMPGDCSPICEITGLDDPKVQETLKSLEIASYWKMHCLLYATIAGISNPGGHGKKRIALRPALTLSGEFDCSETPELMANVDEDGFWDRIATPAAGDKALVLLTKKGESYVISGASGSTIPGLQSPICVVSDLGDHRVEEALSAVRKERNARIRPDKLPIESLVISTPRFIDQAPDLKCVWGDAFMKITPGLDPRAALAFRMDVVGAPPAGEATSKIKFRAEYSYEGLKAGQLVAMLGAVFNVKSVNANGSDGGMLQMDRVTDPELLDDVGICENACAISVGDQVTFKYDDGPDVAIVRLKSISGYKPSSAMLEVRAGTVASRHVASGDTVRLGRDLSLKIGKIIPQYYGCGVRGWVELVPLVNSATVK